VISSGDVLKYLGHQAWKVLQYGPLKMFQKQNTWDENNKVGVWNIKD